MNVDAFIEGLSAEASIAVRGLLHQAYERGFREALASAGQVAVATGSTGTDAGAPQMASVVPLPVASSPPQIEPSASEPAKVEWSGDDSEDLDDTPDEDEDPAEAHAHPPRPILPNATVGTLRKRIIRTFDLERFNIEVVICRRGDRDRRQLKTSVRLGSYRREEG